MEKTKANRTRRAVWGRVCALAMGLVLAQAAMGQRVGAQIAASVVTGDAPLAVFFDASGSVCADSSLLPFHDLVYQWNFGDYAAGNWNFKPQSKNRMLGTLAAHVFDSAGLHIVALEAIAPSGDTYTKPLIIKVKEPKQETICFSSSGDFADAPYPAQQVRIQALEEAQMYMGNGRRLLFKRGDVFLTEKGLRLEGVTGLTIGAFGYCREQNAKRMCANAPLIEMTAPNRTAIWVGDSVSNLTIEGLSVVSAHPRNVGIRLAGAAAQVLVYRTAVSGMMTAVDVAHEGASRVFVADCMLQDGQAGGSLVRLRGERVALLNSDCFNATQGNNNVLVENARRVLISHNRLRYSAPNFHCLLAQYKNAGEGQLVDAQLLIADNEMEGSAGCKSLVKVHGFSTAIVDNVLLEGNYLHTSLAASLTKVLHLQARSMTVRSNILNGSGGSVSSFTGVYVANLPPTIRPVIHIQNNTIYKEEPVQQFVGVRVPAGAALEGINNNLIYSPKAKVVRLIEQPTSPIAPQDNVQASVHPFIKDPPRTALDFQLDSAAASIVGRRKPIGIIRDYLQQIHFEEPFISVGAFQLSPRVVVLTPDAAAFHATLNTNEWSDAQRHYYVLDLSKLTEPYDVTVLDETGSVIHTDLGQRDIFYVWNTKGLANGIYWLKIGAPSCTFLHKVRLHR